MLKCIQCRPHYWHVASPSCSTGSSPFASSCSVLPSCVRISPSSLCSPSFSAARTANCLSTSALAPMLITLSAFKTDFPMPSQHGLICASGPLEPRLSGLNRSWALENAFWPALREADFRLLPFCGAPFPRMWWGSSLDSVHWRPCRFMQQCWLVQMIQPWRVNFDNFRPVLFQLQIQNAAVNWIVLLPASPSPGLFEELILIWSRIWQAMIVSRSGRL